MSKAYIDRINVFGFKSYGSRKLTIPLGEGFIGIVGPNGSGKSNIGDAIVFALGLATAKSMRALKLTDLIFSSKGKTAPYAEVEIVFKNNGAFPLNTEEVSIYRRVDLNGKSTYKINGRTAKYYEVEELLSEAGIPRQAYNIITQGDIFRFIKMTPYERRELLSELAGINEYEEKKESAINDLKEIEEKLNSSKLVLKEIKAQLKRIEEEKESAEKAKYLEEKIKSLQTKLKGVKLFNLIRDKEEYIKELKNIENKLSAYFKEREHLRISQRETIEKIKQLESLLEEIQKELLPFKEKEGYINADINNLKIKKEDLLKQKEKLISEMERYIKEKDSIEKEKQELKEKLKNLNEELKRIDELLKENEKLLNEKSEEIKSYEEDGEDLQQKLIELEKKEKSLKEKESLKEREKIHIELELSKLDEKEKSYKKELVSLKEKLKKLKQSSLNIENFAEIQEKRIKSLNNELKRLKVRKEILDKRLISLREKKEKLFHKLAEVLAKLSSLKEDKISSFLKDIEGVYGSVAELITVKDNELIKAIEVAGGGRLKNIVVKDDRVAEKCIRFLKEKKLGKASFIPLNRVRVSQPIKPPLKSGVLGLAIDFIDYPREIEKAIFYVFGDTLIVEDFETARNVGIGIFRMTTVDGDLFEKSGVITGGSEKNKEGALLNKNILEKEKSDIEKEEEKLKLEEETIEEELKQIDERVKQREIELLKLETEIKSSLERYNELKEEINFIENRIEFLDRELGNILQKRLTEEERLESLNRELKDIKEGLSKIEKDKRELLESLEKKGLKKIKKEWEDILNKVYRIREQKNSLISQIEKYEEILKVNLDENIKKINLKLEELVFNIKNIENQIEEIEKNIHTLQEELLKLGEKFKEKEVESKNTHINISKLRKHLSDLRKREDEINKQITFLLEDKGKLEQKVEDIENEIYILQREQNIEPIDEDIKLIQNELNRYISEREKLGAINERALEDYKVIKNRYEELKSKVQKLEEEKNRIEELINELEDKKEKAFLEVFNKVNKNLKAIFKELSPSGKAYLELENEKTPLDGGVFLKARPRGKDVKRLEIMSGGEKTLTALAFLFAVQQYKPAPFYYFDEVDAHLDDANARKIGQLMKKFSKEAQFIVVTLRDTLAHFSDRLIGVSSREGISQIYTLEVSELLGDTSEIKV